MGGTLTPHLAKVGGGQVGEVGGRPVREPPTPTTSIGRGCGGGGGCCADGFRQQYARAREAAARDYRRHRAGARRGGSKVD